MYNKKMVNFLSLLDLKDNRKCILLMLRRMKTLSWLQLLFPEPQFQV